MVWLFWLMAVALGAPELDIERGLAAMQRNAYEEARRHALTALGESPNGAEAQQLYIDATSAAGFGSRALKELSAYEVETPPWSALRAEFKEALDENDRKRIKAAFKGLFDNYPDHPELLAPVWGGDSLQTRIMALRIQRRYVTAKARENADLTKLYRIRRLVMEADNLDWLRDVDEVLAARGEPTVPSRAPYDRIGRTRYAERLATSDNLPLTGYPNELLDVVDRASKLLFKGARFARAADLYQQLQRLTGVPEAWSGEAEAWRRAGKLERARSVADQAVAHAAAPRSTDLGLGNERRLRDALSRALLVSSRIHEAMENPLDAQIDLALAHLFAEKVLDDKLAERLAKARRPYDVQLESRFRDRRDPIAAVLGDAAASPEPGAIKRNVRDALLLLTAGTKGSLRIARSPESFQTPISQPLMLRSRAEKQLGQLGLARSYAVMATLLAGRSRPWWWAERGSLQQQNGEDDAAFHSYAKARGMGVHGLEGAVAQAYIGLGDWRVAAVHVGGVPPEESVAPQLGMPVSVAPTTTSTRPTGAPSLGEPMPSFVIPARRGRIDSTFLRGRVVILSFFTSECDSCLQMLPQFGTVARRLRQQGMDAVVIAVSIDEDPAEYQRVARLGGRWGEVVHQPELGERFGVDRLPTTWLIDASGIARFYIDHWFSGEELLDYIRQIN